MKNIVDKLNPVGLVEIVDCESGECVYKTHNMIVDTGRQLILNALFKSGGEILKQANFIKYAEKNNQTITTPEFVYINDKVNSSNVPYSVRESNILTDGIQNTSINTTTAITGPNETTYTDKLDAENIKIELHFKIAYEKGNATYLPITSIGLLYKKDDGTKVLFSRAAIDPVYMRYGRTYIVHYTIYF